MNKTFLLLIFIFHSTKSDLDFVNKNTRISIVEPSSLESIFRDGIDDFSVGNMGNIPYDKSIRGHVVKAEPFDGCTQISNKTQRAPILLMQRGNCTFNQKVMNAQMVGAQLVLVIDNVDETENLLQIMSDNHTGDVDIPLIMISMKDGLQIMKYVQSTRDEHSVVINIEFPKLKHMKMTDVDIWISSNDYHSMTMAKDLVSTFQNEFRDEQNIQLQLGYVYYMCVACAKTNYKTQMDNCVCAGRYCFHSIPESNLKGEEIVFENIRQKCIYMHHRNRYVDYLENYQQMCFNSVSEKLNPNMQECTQNIRNRMQLDKVDSCFDDSFSFPSSKLAAGDNSIAKQDRDRFTQTNLHSYPMVFINDLQYKGKLHGPNILLSICNSFNSDSIPRHCKTIIHSKENYDKMIEIIAENNSHGSSIIVYLVSLLIVLTFLLVLYRRHLKREMKEEMQMQVNSAISEYHALHDSKKTEQIQ